jgi:hypothetical protein
MTSKKRKTSLGLLWLVLELRYQAVELPEFDIMAISKSFRLLDRGRIIAAHQMFEVGDMAVRTD